MNLEKVLSGCMFVYLGNIAIRTVSILRAHGKAFFFFFKKTQPKFKKYHVTHIPGTTSCYGCP